MTKKKLVAMVLSAAVLCVFALSAAACGKRDELTAVRIGAVDDGGVLNDNARIAQNLGYFEEELAKIGCKPEYLSFGWGSQPLNEAMAAGKLDVIITDQISQLILKSSGVNIKAIAGNNLRGPNGVTVQANSDIQTVKDLEGKKIVVPAGSPEIYFRHLVEFYGVDTSGIQKFVNAEDVMSIFAYGQADAVIYGLYTSYYMEESNGIGRTIVTTEDHPEWTSQNFVSGKDEYWKANPEVAKAICRAMVRAQAWAEETAKTDADTVFAKMSKDELSAKINERLYGYDLSFSFFRPMITEESVSKLEEVIAYLLAEGMITENIAAADFVDSSYCAAVL